jgi:hypothetical protein
MFSLNKQNSIIKNDINLEAYCIYGNTDQAKKYITQASSKRDWMDKDGQKYAYNCIPMIAANQAGYWIVYNNETEIFWNGGPNTKDVKIIHRDQKDEFNTCSSHFTVGIVTFIFPIIFKTPPGWGLWISGCPNYPINGLHALEAIVETNWSPFTFTMNFKITEPNKLITIKKNTPICRVMPYPLNLNEKTQIQFKKLDANKELKKTHKEWSYSRTKLNEAFKKGETKKRQFVYKDGVNIKGENISEGHHKLNYKFKEIKNEDIEKCPFLSFMKKLKNK